METGADSGIGGFGGRLQEMSRLNVLLTAAGMEPVSAELSERFSRYWLLLAKWNSKLNLSGIRSEEEVLRRHFVECIFCARQLPSGISTLLDFGSGAGFPGIPIALCRPEIAVTLAESQMKKSAFLREVIRELDVEANIHAGRAEDLSSSFDAVAMRAVDKMNEAVSAAVKLTAPAGILVVLTSKSSEVPERYATLNWSDPVSLPYSNQNVLLTVRMRS